MLGALLKVGGIFSFYEDFIVHLFFHMLISIVGNPCIVDVIAFELTMLWIE